VTHAARRALLAILLPALLLAQVLGLLHATLHAGMNGAPPAAVAQPVAARPVAKGWVADLFGAHADAPACRLYDQLSHGDAAVHGAPAAAPLQACATTPFFLLPVVAYAGTAGFHARGPPALR
jgi:hypothetical protein